MLIQRTVAPNGNYAIQLSENGNIFKKVSKCFLNGTSEVVDTYNSKTGKGIYLSSVDAADGGARFYKVFDKVTENGITTDGLIYLIRKNDDFRYMCNVRTLDGTSCLPKPGAKCQWFVQKFAELFNR